MGFTLWLFLGFTTTPLHSKHPVNPPMHG